MSENEPMRVAFIDDEEDVRRAGAQSLALAGFEVETYDSALSALEHLDARFPGAVVSDVRMPRMDGIELFRRLHALDADLPVILATGHGDIEMAVGPCAMAPMTSSPSPIPPRA
ncbi:response regulator [Oleomonas cavernae]|uniref:response regulator n=1 Tax=Oleomonas cavernae TaxID=2320859 RepID=UPI0026C3A215